jgi:prepilin-type N-terminal cleavage/methylation domain-containing protein
MTVRDSATTNSAAGRQGVTVLEVVLAMVILGLVALIAIPRLSPAATAPDSGTLLRERLRILRVAIERYYQDHGVYPGQRGDGRNAARTEAAVLAQLVRFTAVEGDVAEIGDEVHCCGPYLRDGMLICPVPPRAGLAGVHVIGGTAAPAFIEQALEAGWVYNCDTGRIGPNSNATDSAGRPYTSY